MNSVLGLMLGGGGAKGAYQLGVIRALYEYKIINKLSCISGTSIGAVNTMLMLSCKTYEQIRDSWFLINNEVVFKNKKTDYSGLFDIRAMENVLIKRLDLDYLRHNKIQGFVTCSKILDRSWLLSQINLSKLERVIFHLNSSTNAIDATIASASIPLVFGSKQIGDDFYVDGGLVDQNPYDPLLSFGANVIFAVPLGLKIKTKSNIKDSSVLHIDFLVKGLFGTSLASDLTEAVKFNFPFIKRNYLLGYHIAKEMIDKLIANKVMIINDDIITFNRNEVYTKIEFDKKESKILLRKYKDLGK